MFCGNFIRENIFNGEGIQRFVERTCKKIWLLMAQEHKQVHLTAQELSENMPKL